MSCTAVKQAPARSEAARRVAAQTAARLRWHPAHPEDIRRRLRALDRECDAEQALRSNAATIACSGLAAGAALDLRGLALPALVTASLMQYILTGRCPSLPILRSLGFRTPVEIDTERKVLKSLLRELSAPAAPSRRAGRQERRVPRTAPDRAAVRSGAVSRVSARGAVPPRHKV